ncbi:MAG: Rieske (2Fe-2S) protein [Candidatus Dormibacteria bacterium]
MSTVSEGPGGSAGRSGFTPLNVLGAPAPPPPPVESDVGAEIAALGERVGELIDGLNGHADPEVGARVNELLDAIDHLHREALTRLAGLLGHHDLLVHACDDPVIGAALDLYELRPEADTTAGDASSAVGGAATTGPAPAAAAGGGASQPGLIPLNAAMGAMPAPPRPSAIGLNDNVAVGSTGPSIRTTPVPMAPVKTAVAEDEPHEWLPVCDSGDISPGAVEAPDEGALLLARLDGNLHAYRNGCGNGPLALHMGRVIDGRRLACPWHIGCVYDLTTGFSGEPPDQRRLIRYPVRERDGMIEVAFNKGVVPEAPGPAAPVTG